MNAKRTLIGLAAVMISPWLWAGDIAAGDLPGDTRWYVHVDFERMRTSNGVGRTFFDHIAEKVFVKIDEELGIDLTNVLDGVTAFGSQEGDNAAVVLHGAFDKDKRQQLIDVIKTGSDYKLEKRKGLEVHTFTELHIDGDGDLNIRSRFHDDEQSFVVFSKKGQILITRVEAMVDAFVESGGRIHREDTDQSNAVLVLHAERSLVRGGLNANTPHEPTRWDSAVLKNVEQIGIVMADEGWAASIRAELVTNSAEMAQSLTNIVQGIVSLKALTSDNEPEIQKLLSNTRIELNDRVIVISTHLETATLMELMD